MENEVAWCDSDNGDDIDSNQGSCWFDRFAPAFPRDLVSPRSSFPEISILTENWMRRTHAGEQAIGNLPLSAAMAAVG